MREKGQTLIEALISLAVAIIVISAIVVAVISSLNNVQFTRNQNLANIYAQQGMEIVRGIRNSSWSTFLNLSSTNYCLSSSSATLDLRQGTGCGQNVGIFIREVIINHSDIDPNILKKCDTETTKASLVTVNVSWSDSRCTDRNDLYCHKTSIVSCFGNDSALPTP